MPSTGLIKAFTTTLDSGTTMTNADALTQDGEGTATIISQGGVTLNFASNVGSQAIIPQGSTITDIRFQISGVPFHSLISQLETFYNILFDNIVTVPPHPSPGTLIEDELGEGTAFSVPTFFTSGAPAGSFTLEGSSLVDLLLREQTKTMLTITNPPLVTIDNSQILSKLVEGTANITLRLSFNDFSSFGSAGQLEIDGDNTGLEIIYNEALITSPKVKIQESGIPITQDGDGNFIFFASKTKLQPITTFSNVESVIAGPNSNDVLGDVGDGLTYSSPLGSIRNRLMQTSTTSNPICGFSSIPSGFKIFNFFDSNQIPLNAIITGVELIAGTDFDGSGDSSIRSFTQNSGQIRIECRFHNGVNYSDRLTWDTSQEYDGISFFNIEGGTNNRASLSGQNRHYKNATEGDDVLFGGPNDLSGLEWDPNNQSSFGFGFAAPDSNGIVSGGVLRGIRMKVYYQIPISISPRVLIN